jgi:hypothetical protein
MSLVTQVSKEQIERLQTEMAALPQLELVTEHSFSPGMYLRKVYRPAGTLIVGKVHKEPHFFERVNVSVYDQQRGRQELMSLFPDVEKCKNAEGARYLDGSTIFSRTKKNIGAMSQYYTDEEKQKLKFIVLLREPVSRDYSWYSQVIRDRLGRDKIQFQDLSTLMEYDRKHLAEPITHVHRGGDYVNQLETFVKVFRRDQLLVLSSTAVFQNSSKVMDAIAGFLEISKPAAWAGQFPHDDHLETFQDIISCISIYTPKLDCKFRLNSLFSP